MNKSEIKQIILEEIKLALSEMGPDPELYPDGYDFPDNDEAALAMAAMSRPDEDDMGMDMDMDLEEMARTPNVFKLSRNADYKEVLQFMGRVNDLLTGKSRFNWGAYKSPGQKKPKKAFTPEEMKALAQVLINPEGFTSKDIIAATSYNSPAQANKFLQALEMKGLITLTSQLKKAMAPERDPNAPETRGRKKKAIDVPLPTPDDEDFDMGDFEDLDMSPIGENIKKYVKKYIREAKSPLANKMKEVETRGRIAALETKLAAVQEMIDETNERLTRIDEDNEFNEMMDKSKVKDVRKQLKELEKAQAKLQKEYEKVSGGRRKEKVVGEKKDDIPENPNDPKDHPALPEASLKEEVEEYTVNFFGKTAKIKASNASEAKSIAGDMWNVPGPDMEYVRVKLPNPLDDPNFGNKKPKPMNESLLRMQKLAGLITEGEYKAKLIKENANQLPKDAPAMEENEIQDFLSRQLPEEWPGSWTGDMMTGNFTAPYEHIMLATDQEGVEDYFYEREEMINQLPTEWVKVEEYTTGEHNGIDYQVMNFAKYVPGEGIYVAATTDAIGQQIREASMLDSMTPEQRDVYDQLYNTYISDIDIMNDTVESVMARVKGDSSLDTLSPNESQRVLRALAWVVQQQLEQF